jgi:hypothetical protein
LSVPPRRKTPKEIVESIVDITNIFFSSIKQKEVLTFSHCFHQSPVDFQYDGKVWTAEVTKQVALASNLTDPVTSIKVEIPTDLLTCALLSEEGTDDLKVNSETMGLVTVLASHVNTIPDFEYLLRINFKEQAGLLEFYFEDEENCKAVNILFTSGTYKYSIEKKKYSKEELTNINRFFGS